MPRWIGFLMICILVFVYLDIRMFGSSVLVDLPQEQWDLLISRLNQVLYWTAIWVIAFWLIVQIGHLKHIMLERVARFRIPRWAESILGFMSITAVIFLVVYFGWELEQIIVNNAFGAH